jgi:hypothetical protein
MTSSLLVPKFKNAEIHSLWQQMARSAAVDFMSAMVSCAIFALDAIKITHTSCESCVLLNSTWSQHVSSGPHTAFLVSERALRILYAKLQKSRKSIYYDLNVAGMSLVIIFVASAKISWEAYSFRPRLICRRFKRRVGKSTEPGPKNCAP